MYMERFENHINKEKYCVKLIHEFLLCHEFSATLSAFKEELPRLGYQNVVENIIKKEHIKRMHVHQLIELFICANYEQFYKAWESFVPHEIQILLEYKKLTFYLHVHFAVLPFRRKENVQTVINEDKEPTSVVLKETGFSKNKNHVDDIKTNEELLPELAKNEYTLRNDNKENLSPIVEYDKDSLDQSSVMIEQDDSSLIVQGKNENKSTYKDTAMEVLKLFLTTKGPEFSSQPEFLPFFALPFINNPVEHPSFSNIFTEEWLTTLTQRFQKFLYEFSCGDSVTPELIKLCKLKEKCESTQNSGTDAIHNTDINQRHRCLKRKFSKLHKDYQNLIGVASELTGALENSARGLAVDLKATLNNCAHMFPELFVKTLPTDSRSIYVKKVPHVEPLTNSKVLCCSQLDVQKIKSHLSTGSIKTKLLLLQALRWRMTQGTGEERDQAIAWFSRYDVLSVHNDILAGMLSPKHVSTPHPIQQAAARLLNTVASVHSGRDYLASSQTLLHLLITTLKQKDVKIDTVTSYMVLATLQKLSLRRSHRAVMIDQGLVEWLADILSEGCDHAYALEYSTALLMNLCLHEEARDRCSTNIVKVLMGLLDVQQSQVFSVVAATLYCLLFREDMNQAALDLHLENALIGHLEYDSIIPHLRKQIEALLRLHRNEIPADSVQIICEETSEDELDDPDELEMELDADDPVHAIAGDHSGEALLQNQYRRIFPAHSVVFPSSTKQEVDIYIQSATPCSVHTPKDNHNVRCDAEERSQAKVVAEGREATSTIQLGSLICVFMVMRCWESSSDSPATPWKCIFGVRLLRGHDLAFASFHQTPLGILTVAADIPSHLKTPQPEITVILKRTANAIFEEGGVIRRIDNLGVKETPFKISKHGTVHREASYFLFEFNYPPSKVQDLGKLYNKDVDIIRKRIYRLDPEEAYECTIEEEMKPAPYRLEVQKMIEESKKRDTKKTKFSYNTGLDYYPFQK